MVALTAGENRLAALNPKSVLNRGYSITTNKQTGQVVRSADEIGINDFLVTELANENFIESQVTKKTKEERADNAGRSELSD
jgi:exonuclease VII large subunit